MNKIIKILCLVLTFSGFSNYGNCEDTSGDYVVLIHGLGRTSGSFKKMKKYLEKMNFQVLNINYPSRDYQIQSLSNLYVKDKIEKFCIDESKKINYVTHSLGGIILRYYLNSNPDDDEIKRSFRD